MVRTFFLCQISTNSSVAEINFMYNQSKLMDALDFDGKRYVKISSAARETGYTSDYIGQLCRAKKIDAKLVGRTWYVHFDELHSHQRTRGRSSHEKARKAVKEHLLAGNEQETNIPIHIAHSSSVPEYRKRIVNAEIRYHNDDRELLPRTSAIHLSLPNDIPNNKAEEISISSEQKLKIEESDGTPVAFKKTEKPEIKWNGTIVVEPLEDVAEEVSPQRRDTAPGTLHLHIHEEEARLTRPAMSVEEDIHDPLAIKERFLTRLNKAHDFNDVEVSREETSVPAQVGHQRWAKDRVLKAIKPAPVKQSGLGLQVAMVLGVFLFYIASTVLVENRLGYVGGISSTKTSPVYVTEFGISSFGSLKNNASNVISSTRDIF